MLNNREMEIIEQRLNYTFQNKSLIQLAFVHSSVAHMEKTESNERLEFLGDSVLNLIITKFLFGESAQNEGELSKIRAHLVSSESLSRCIDEMSLIDYLRVNTFNASESENVKCDLFEAILGAMFLDSNFLTCEKFVFDVLNLEKLDLKKLFDDNTDYKSKLQEFLQRSKGNELKYEELSVKGPAHKPEFEIGAFVNGELIAKAKGPSRRKTENLVAKLTLDKLNGKE